MCKKKEKKQDSPITGFATYVDGNDYHPTRDITWISSYMITGHAVSKAETKEFPEEKVSASKLARLEEKIEKAKSHLELLKSSYMNDGNNGTDDTAPTFKAFEEGSETMSKEANTQLAIRQEKFIRDLKNALLRIENKTYGICRVTGKLINKERLKLVPHATLSIEAKNMQK